MSCLKVKQIEHEVCFLLLWCVVNFMIETFLINVILYTELYKMTYNRVPQFDCLAMCVKILFSFF